MHWSRLACCVMVTKARAEPDRWHGVHQRD
jgi:hypothetical protein